MITAWHGECSSNNLRASLRCQEIQNHGSNTSKGSHASLHSCHPPWIHVLLFWHFTSCDWPGRRDRLYGSILCTWLNPSCFGYHASHTDAKVSSSSEHTETGT